MEPCHEVVGYPIPGMPSSPKVPPAFGELLPREVGSAERAPPDRLHRLWPRWLAGHVFDTSAQREPAEVGTHPVLGAVVFVRHAFVQELGRESSPGSSIALDELRPPCIVNA